MFVGLVLLCALATTHAKRNCLLCDTWCACLQGANITYNNVPGLVVNGSADVTVSNSNFTRNERPSYSGGALVIAGNATARVLGTVFILNGAAMPTRMDWKWDAGVRETAAVANSIAVGVDTWNACSRL